MVSRALSEGPQRISWKSETVVVISVSEYEKITGKQKRFKEMLTSVPGFDDLILERKHEPGRKKQP